MTLYCDTILEILETVVYSMILLSGAKDPGFNSRLSPGQQFFTKHMDKKDLNAFTADLVLKS